MARLPVSPDALVAQYGPRLGFPPKEGFPGRDEPDRVVPTHCCFCGMQCGIKLLVKDNRIVGFDPWEEFPFNEGRLCPKGVQRYLQNNHPDRLLSPLRGSRARGSARCRGTRRSTAPSPRSSGSRRSTGRTPSRCSAASR